MLCVEDMVCRRYFGVAFEALLDATLNIWQPKYLLHRASAPYLLHRAFEGPFGELSDPATRDKLSL